MSGCKTWGALLERFPSVHHTSLDAVCTGSEDR